MIVVLKPSGSYGHSFMGLNAYCVEDQDRKADERVDWIETRNLATDDPHKAARLMVNTARAQNHLKRANGIRTGNAPKDGPVLHTVLAFADGEPLSREDMTKAADEFLSRLGADPKLARKAKTAPKRRQFADEHEVVMYCHNDSSNGAKHLHLMINRIHPQTGVLLPDKNDRDKAQSWALKYSKEHLTDHLTPARQENHDERRKRGSDGKRQWVKHPNRLHQTAYELQKELRATAENDNARIVAIKDTQRRKDHQLGEQRRQQDVQSHADMAALLRDDEERKNVIYLEERRNIRNALAPIRDKYRPLKKALENEIKHNRRVFEKLEQSFHGKITNALRGATDAVLHGGSTGLKRVYAISSNASERLRALERAEKRKRDALARQRKLEEERAIAAIKRAQHVKFEANKFRLGVAKLDLEKKIKAKRDAIRSQWRTRNEERRKAAFNMLSIAKALAKAKAVAKRVQPVFQKASTLIKRQRTDSSSSDTRASNVLPTDLKKVATIKSAPTKKKPPTLPRIRIEKTNVRVTSQQAKRRTEAFKDAVRRPAREQNNERDRYTS